MKVTLRKRQQGGKISLYLDYYHKGERKKEYLKLYLDPDPKSMIDKDLNKRTLQLAESIRAKRMIEIQNGIFGFRDSEKLKGSFLDYVEHLAKKRFNSKGNFGNWDSMYKHLKSYSPPKTTFGDINREYVQGFKEYLEDEARTKSNQPLSQNSKSSYFNKFRAALKQAVKDGILQTNPAEGIDAIKQGDTYREFLTLEELEALAVVECDMPELKRAFIFSCLTGLRWSDIEKLVWSEVQQSEAVPFYLRFRQQKTQGAETLPITDQAFELLGERGGKDDRVFNGLKYSAWHNLKLQQWVMRAGINKKISFHCARHTYATLQMSAGTDIFVVSNMLGHKDLKTTQIYTKVIDEKKIEAANKIRLRL